jgi:sialate O-acetylesterase
VYLEPVPAVATPTTLTVTGQNAVTLQDILVGEVWLASGQSNMEWPVERSNDAAAEIAAANHPQIREFNATNTVADQPADAVAGTWQICAPETAGRLSAVAYYFARDLHRKLGVPVGILNSTWGGTPVESWTDLVTLKSTTAWPAIDARWQQALAEHPERTANYPAERAAYQEAAEKAKATKTQNTVPWPRAPAGPGTPYALSGLYNGMIAPLQPYALRGAIWYQGESNVARAYQYRELFPLMIRNWRRDFLNPDMPFGFVQLAPYNYGGDRGDALPELWEAQVMTLKHLKNIGMAVTTDIATTSNIHPPNKQDVGKRLGLWALATIYGERVVYSGPIYQGCEVHADAVSISFSHVGSGLTTSDGEMPSHFTVAGADRVFHPAAAQIVGSRVIVSSDEVKHPVAVRFAWSNTAEPNLKNREGLPASPFRTDDWPGITIDTVRP